MFLTKLKNITTFIFDIDGVLTNSTILSTESGEFLRTFNVKDGYAIQLAQKKGYKVCIISGGFGHALVKRFQTLGVADVFLGIQDKEPIFNQFLADNKLTAEEILYMGDDLPDLPVLNLVGIAACPADAVEEIKAVSLYISPKKGGEGAVRDVIEKVLKVQGNWHINAQTATTTSL